MAEPGPSKNMDWMYKGPSALVDREDYLLGRAVDKSFKLLEAQEKGQPAFSYADEVEKDLTPASIFASRSSGATPVDLIRKIKEDPLYQIEKKEQETIKQLLQNPIKMKQLKKLADQRKSSSKSKKSKKKHKKRSSSSDSDSERKLDKSTIDKLLAAKLNAFKKKSGKNDTSSSSSSSSSDDEERKSKSSKDYYSHSRSRSTDRYKPESKDNKRDDHYNRRRDDRDRTRDHRSDRFRRPDSRDRDRRDNARRRSRSRSPRSHSSTKVGISSSTSSRYQSKPQPQRKALSEEEMEKRRREMMDNAKVRDEDRKKNVERWKEEQKKEEEELAAKKHDAEFIRKHLLSAAESGSVEKRIKANSYNIQKSSSAMNQNFARR